MNDHVTKPIDPAQLYGALFKWLPVARLAERRKRQQQQSAVMTQTPATAQPERGSDAPLPDIAGVDWQQALASVDHQRGRLDKRIHAFLQEYQPTLQTVREAVAGQRYTELRFVAHNLKSSAAYIGAFDLAVQAQAVEQVLHSGRDDRIGALSAELVDNLAMVVGALARIGVPPAPQQRAGAGEDATTLIARLAACLHGDDARAEDVLQELRTRPAVIHHTDKLDAIQRAIDEIEYKAALTPLNALAQALHIQVEETP
jgi:HPt (histidine-containing phosphotransfer) domain-containing protein